MRNLHAADPIGTLYYFGDPMCSWCWGFKPVLEQMEREYPELRRVTVMGGLRRGEEVPMDESLADMIRNAWFRIEETTGQPFDHRFWEMHRPLATTLPACRAVLTARILAAEKEWPFMVGLFEAYFTRLRDPSRSETQLQVACSLGFDADRFEETLNSPEVETALLRDLRWGETLGVHGYPTLVLKVGEKYYLVSPGYQPIEGLRRAINIVYESHGIAFTRPESGLYA